MRAMRPIVPLCTAAALALGGWLAWSIVTVHSLDDPSRIGLLRPLSCLVSLLLILLVPGWWAARTAVRSPADVAASSWHRAGIAAVLMAPIVWPWTPLPVPQAALVWTGPLAIGLWLAAVACVHADVWPRRRTPRRGGSTERRDPPLPVERRHNPVAVPAVVAALVTGAALAATAWHTSPQHPRGDEPDYLIVAQSLWLDGDLQIEDNHARADYAAYHREVLPPSYLQRGVNGRIYSVHAPGLPAAVLPAFALAGYRGVVALLIVVAMAGAALVWRTAYDATGDMAASWVGAAATVGSAPFFLHGAAVFPDAPASVLALVATRALLRASRGRPVRWWMVGAALSALPWLHTRYAVIAAVLGLAAGAHLARTRNWTALARLAVGPVAMACLWLAFFHVVYGTPNPSAPYGAYTQMALAHLAPGLPGLLVDQQFGLLAAAPILGLAVVALRPSIRARQPAVWRIALVVIALAGLYACTVGAYRMWWGGLSAPARFLVPMILPLAPLVAIAWQSLRTRASRHGAVGLLAVSLGMTAVMVVADHGALAYNTRDGAAGWALWAGPLVDLVAVLPAAHRDAPMIVVRDAMVWAALLGAGWWIWRWLETRGRLQAWVSVLTMAAWLPVAVAVNSAVHGTPTLQPVASQVQFLERRASSPASTLWTITPPPVGRTRRWFEVELDTRRGAGRGDVALLRIGSLPAGRYQLHTSVREAGARFGVTLGDARTTRFLAELAVADTAPVDVTLPLPVAGLVVKGSTTAAAAGGRTWLSARDVRPDVRDSPATRTHPFADGLWLLPARDVYPEPDGIWLAGDSTIVVGLPANRPLPVRINAGAAPVVVEWAGRGGGEVRLAAGEERAVVLTPDRGRLQLRTRGGFRPSRVTPGSDDQRWLGAWIAPRPAGQNRATPIR